MAIPVKLGFRIFSFNLCRSGSGRLNQVGRRCRQPCAAFKRSSTRRSNPEQRFIQEIIGSTPARKRRRRLYAHRLRHIFSTVSPRFLAKHTSLICHFLRAGQGKLDRRIAALDALKGDQTIVELSQRYQVHPNQITEWKKQLLERAADVFSKDRKPNRG